MIVDTTVSKMESRIQERSENVFLLSEFEVPDSWVTPDWVCLGNLPSSGNLLVTVNPDRITVNPYRTGTFNDSMPVTYTL